MLRRSCRLASVSPPRFVRGRRLLAALVCGLGTSGLAAPAQAQKSVVVVLDASGSMRARLPDGTVRIDAAKDAVRRFVGGLDPKLRLAMRVYGHQSPTSARNCNDTALVVGFDTAGNSAAAIGAALPAIEARGYTPITRVLGLAADDIRGEPAKQRVIVLVSDGKETCDGDPCATARALARAHADLVIHSIGFAVDAAARLQLQCVARAAGGRYFAAASAGELARSLNEAIAAPRQVVSEPKGRADKPGHLRVKGADRHRVLDAETGQQVTEIGYTHETRPLKPGLYHVTVGGGTWKSIEVRAGEVTEIAPAVVALRRAGSRPAEVRDPETGEALGRLDGMKNRAVLIPSRYVVAFGDVPAPEVTLEPGRNHVIDNATVTLGRAPFGRYTLRDGEGRVAGEMSTSHATVAVPPGRYVLGGSGKSATIDVAAGDDVKVDLD